MLKRCLLAAVATLLLAAAPPQKLPPLHAPANSQQADTPTKNDAQHVAADRRGTERAPLIVKIVRSRQDKAATDNEKHTRDEQSVTEHALADYTWYLAAFTLLLVGVAAAQAGLFVWQLRYMREGLRDAAEAASAAVAQAATAQKTFEKLERPYLYSTIDRSFRLDEYDCPYVAYDVVNHGKIAAKIREVHIHNGRSLNLAPAADALLIGLDERLLVNRVLGPGEARPGIRNDPANDDSLRWRGISNEPDDGHWIGKYPDLAPGDEYFFYIRILYDGPFTEGHVTSACWHVVHQTFQEFGGAQYNFIT